MPSSYEIKDTLPEFEVDNAALSALVMEITKKAPIHQIYFYKKDILFDKRKFQENGKLLASTRSTKGSSRTRESDLWLYKNVYIYIRTYSEVSISAVFVNNEDDNGESVKLVFEEFEESYKAIESKVDNSTKVKFWSMSQYGPKYDSKFLEVPAWEDIANNYSQESRKSIQDLMKLDPSSLGSGGKIILLHGPTGTGKTTIIRAIIREWQNWCDVEYIIDPEVILNNSSYLTQVILGNDEDEDELNFLHSFDPNYQESLPDKKSNFRLLVFEDTEDLIATDEKGSVSSSVSRLLNIGDGLLGQGLKVLILITTNVKLEKLHPALKRPGRTLANIYVPPLSKNEATEWIGSNHTEATLAELYEEKNKKQIVLEKTDWETPGMYL